MLNVDLGELTISMDSKGLPFEETNLVLDGYVAGIDIDNPFIPENEYEKCNKILEESKEKDEKETQKQTTLNSVVVQSNIIKNTNTLPIWFKDSNDMQLPNIISDPINANDIKELKDGIKTSGKYFVPNHDYAPWSVECPDLICTDQSRYLNCVGESWYTHIMKNE